MNLTETTALLNGIAMYDNRDVDLEAAKVWQPHLADVTFTEAAAAVHAHFDHTSAWIMPSDVMNRIRAARSARLAAANLIYDGDPSETPQQYLANIRNRIAAIAAGEATPPLPQALGRRPVRELLAAEADATQLPPAIADALERARAAGYGNPCPACGADPGKPCRRSSGKRMTGTHPSRETAGQCTTFHGQPNVNDQSGSEVF